MLLRSSLATPLVFVSLASCSSLRPAYAKPRTHISARDHPERGLGFRVDACLEALERNTHVALLSILRLPFYAFAYSLKLTVAAFGFRDATTPIA